MVQVTKDGITYTAAQNAPSLPADVGAPVHAIIGLQPFRHAYKHRARTLMVHNRATLNPNGQPAPNIANTPPYLVSEILKAYAANGLGVTGKGQTIAILIDTFPADSDLAAFWKANGVNSNAARIVKVNVAGGHLPPIEGEETLDASWTSGIAPEATIKIYATGSLQFVALDRALDRIVTDAAANSTLRQLSISLGLGETFLGGPNGEIATQHQKYLKLAALGVNVFVSSGDAGSNPGPDGHTANGPLQAEYAASNSTVVGVGGTSPQAQFRQRDGRVRNSMDGKRRRRQQGFYASGLAGMAQECQPGITGRFPTSPPPPIRTRARSSCCTGSHCRSGGRAGPRQCGRLSAPSSTRRATTRAYPRFTTSIR